VDKLLRPGLAFDADTREVHTRFGPSALSPRDFV
jgi:hypothetical protein